MSKTMKKYEIGKAVANASEGRIELTVEDSIATLRGEFTRKDRQPIKFKAGGWRYHKDDSGEFWTLNVGRIIDQLNEPSAEQADEPKVETSAEPKSKTSAKLAAKPKRKAAPKCHYVRFNGETAELFRITRSNEKSVWLVGSDGVEFRKSIGESAERLSGGFYLAS